MCVKSTFDARRPNKTVDEDAAMAAAILMQKLDKGTYLDRGKRRKIDGDFSKLMYAEHLT